MRNYFFILALLAVLPFVSSCDGTEPNPNPGTSVNGKTVIVYISANNSLSTYAEGNFADMLEGYMPPSKANGEHLLVFFHNRTTPPTLYELTRDGSGNPLKEEVHVFDMSSSSGDEDVSSSAEAVNTVLSYVKNNYESDHYGLILWSHSTGWLPEHYYTEGPPAGYPNSEDAPVEPTSPMDIYGDAVVKMAVDDGVQPTSFGQDEGTLEEIDIKELAEAIPMHLDFLIFDSCLMGCVEVAYQFRNIADVFCASPTEVLANGFPYTHIIEPLFTSAEGVKEVADLYFHYYADSEVPGAAATVVVVDCSKLEPLAEACGKIFSENRYKVPELDMSDIQPYFRSNKHWFYDLGAYIKALEPSSSLLDEFRQAMREAVVYKAATETFLSIQITDFSGLSSYIQNPEEPYLDDYYRTLDWNKATQMIAD
ncbi:MAG: hypothetical protein IAB93_06685 [Bacteroidetes bacterium]|uniref:Clostripain n=1 Tax=Candidatus Merdivivens pullistercoris TaxID=2840873 RepID=A0A9D9NA30_9BACT|nr:hypothetical protein [Candidatus Merdivivens pullistercoris]